MNKDEYIKKKEECIKGMKCKELTKVPNDSINTKTQNLIKDGAWPTNMKDLNKISPTAITSRLIGRFKDHK